MYERKTFDEYVLYGNYGYGWDEILTEDTYEEAKKQLRCYRENERNAAFKIRKRRIPKVELKHEI